MSTRIHISKLRPTKRKSGIITFLNPQLCCRDLLLLPASGLALGILSLLLLLFLQPILVSDPHIANNINPIIPWTISLTSWRRRGPAGRGER